MNEVGESSGGDLQQLVFVSSLIEAVQKTSGQVKTKTIRHTEETPSDEINNPTLLERNRDVCSLIWKDGDFQYGALI